MRGFGGVRRLTIPLLFLLTSCTNASETKRTLLDAGYTDIITGGHDFFACGKDDFSATKFTALNPKGNRNVKGTVCCGLLKSCTIRH